MRTYSQQAERNGFVVVLLMLVKHGTANEIGLKLLKNAKTYSQSLVPEIYALTKKMCQFIRCYANVDRK